MKEDYSGMRWLLCTSPTCYKNIRHTKERHPTVTNNSSLPLLLLRRWVPIHYKRRCLLEQPFRKWNSRAATYQRLVGLCWFDVNLQDDAVYQMQDASRYIKIYQDGCSLTLCSCSGGSVLRGLGVTSPSGSHACGALANNAMPRAQFICLLQAVQTSQTNKLTGCQMTERRR